MWFLKNICVPRLGVRYVSKKTLDSSESSVPSSYDFLKEKLLKDKLSVDWNTLLWDLVSVNRRLYSLEHSRRLINRFNHKNQVYLKGANVPEISVRFKKKMDAKLTESSIDSFVLKVCRDIESPELALKYLNYAKSQNKKLSLNHLVLFLEAVSRGGVKDQELKKEVLSVVKKVEDSIDGIDVQKQYFFQITAALAAVNSDHDALNRYFYADAENVEEDTEEQSYLSAVITAEKLSVKILESNFKENESLFWKIIGHKNFLTTNYSLRSRQNEDVQRSQDKVYCGYIRNCSDYSSLEKLFQFFSDNHVVVSWETIRSIKTKCDEFGITFKITEINNKGNCKSCLRVLETNKFSSQELLLLSDAVYKYCLKDTDIYLSSAPAEVLMFSEFLEKNSDYEVVIDGLNVSLNHSPKFNKEKRIVLKPIDVQSLNLLGIINHLYAKGLKKILIIHRSSIYAFPDYEEIASKAKIYTPKKDSQDDPFILIAALRKGSGTYFVTNDRLRQHNFKLPSEMQKLFTRWQLAHQCFHITISNDRVNLINKTNERHYKYHVTEPHKYNLMAQHNETTWHLPLLQTARGAKGIGVIPSNWACIQKI